MTALPSMVRYVIRDTVTGEYVSVWQSKSLYHEWTSDVDKFRMFKRVEDAIKLSNRLDNAEVVELTYSITARVPSADNKAIAAVNAKIEEARKTIYALDLVDQRLWSDAQDAQYRRARKLLFKHGLDVTKEEVTA